MAVELIKDMFQVDQLVGENTLQAMIEGDILAPDTKPDITRIVAVEGKVQITKKETQENKVLVEGNLRFKVLYASDKGEEPLYSIDSSTEFKEDIVVQGLTPQMKNEVKAELEHIDFNLNNERKIGVRAVINLEAKGLQEIKMEITQDLEGIEDMEVLKETLQYTDIVGTNTSNTLVKEAFELEENLPEIKEVLKCHGVAVEKETKITDGKVIIGGDILLEVLYIGEDEEIGINIIKKEMPFSYFVEIPDVYSDMAYKLKMEIEDIYTDIKENIDGERKILEVESIVNIDITVMETQKRQVVIDAYSPNKSFKLKRDKIQLKESIGIYSSQVLLRENLDLPSNHPPMVEIFSVTGKAILTDYNLMNNKIILEGVLETTVIYNCQEGIQSIYSYMQEIPFRHHLEVEGLGEEMEADIQLLVQSLDFHKINEEQIELRINLGTTCEVHCLKYIDAISDVEELQEAVDIARRPSLTVYFFQEGDSLWKVAKKYHTTVKEIMKSNEIQNPEDIKAGDQIMIEKVYNFSI